MSDALKVSSLTVLGGPRSGTSFQLDQAVDEILIGSDPGCSFALDLPGVSPIHARFWVDLSGAKIFDTRSPSGVYVNDDRVTGEAPVRDGDVIWLGAPGDAGSVMIQCRLVAPAPQGLADTDLGVEEPIVVDEQEPFFVVEAAPAPVAPPARVAVPVPPAPPAPPVVPDPPVEEFLMLDEPPPAVHAAPEPDVFFLGDSPPPAAPPVAAPPAADAIEEFVVDDLPAPPPPRPVAPPAPPPAPRPAAPPPAPKAAPAPPKPAPPPAAVPPVPPPAPPAPPAARVAPPAPAAAPPPPPRPRPAPPVVPAAAPAPAREAEPRPRPAPAERPSRPALARLAPLALGAIVVLAGLAWAAMRLMSAPSLEALSPARARIGETITLRGQHFSADAADDEVAFGDRAGRVLEASATQLKVEVPAVTLIPGRDSEVAVLVRVSGRASKALNLAVYQAPRLHGVSPDVGMPGDEIVLAGAGWGTTVNVKFGAVPAEVVSVSASSIHVRVPALEGTPGTMFPITVAVTADPSNAAPFMFGRLPLVASVSPASASAGDVVTLAGRGFSGRAGADDVRIGGVRALVISASEGELQVGVPFGAGGDTPVEVRVAGKENVAQAMLSVGAPADPVDFRFAAEPLEGAAPAERAVVATALGPAFVVAASGGKSAAQRAQDAAQRLNAAAGPLKASREADVVARDLESQPMLSLAGGNDALLQATAEDAAAYSERAGGRGPAVSPARLAVWWEALARDLVTLLIRGEKPQRASGLAAEGRALGELFDAARRGGGFGVPRATLAAARPATLAALRGLALRVPAAVPAPAGAPSVASAGGSPGAGPLVLDRTWAGFELDDGLKKFITVVFRGRNGTFAYDGGVSVTLPLWGVETPKGGVRFGVEAGGRRRHYTGQWDGSRLTGAISSQPGGKGDLGTFELQPR